jgi:hypothetical protein
VGQIRSEIKTTQTEYLTKEQELQEKLQDATLEIKGMELLENTDHPETDMMLINYMYQEKNEFVEDCLFCFIFLVFLFII